MSNWGIEQIPDQSGRIAVVTGGASGIGFEVALALAGAGAVVIIASRNAEKGEAALEKICSLHPNAEIAFQTLDLSSLASVAEAASRIAEAVPALDLLINNAGVLGIRDRTVTEDGFEMQLAANHFGHFAFTLRLLPNLLATKAPRVVTLSSLTHRQAKLDFEDLQLEQHYHPLRAYARAKLANLLFALELDRRAKQRGWPLVSNAAHPGFVLSDLHSTGPRIGREKPGPLELASRLTGLFIRQTPAQGALPVLFAATAPEAKGGMLYGPDGVYELWGDPAPSKIAAHALDPAIAPRLWDVSEELTGIGLRPADDQSFS